MTPLCKQFQMDTYELSASSNPFDYFPRDVWRHMLAFLRVHELALFRRVCQEAHAVGNNVLETGVRALDLVWYRYYFRFSSPSGVSDFADLLITRCHALEAIRICDMLDVNKLLQLYHNNNSDGNRCLRALSINAPPFPAIFSVSIHCPQLVVLSVETTADGWGLPALVARLPNLQALRLIGCFLRLDIVVAVLRNAPQLRVLDVSCYVCAPQETSTADQNHDHVPASNTESTLDPATQQTVLSAPLLLLSFNSVASAHSLSARVLLLGGRRTAQQLAPRSPLKQLIHSREALLQLFPPLSCQNGRISRNAAVVVVVVVVAVASWRCSIATWGTLLLALNQSLAHRVSCDPCPGSGRRPLPGVGSATNEELQSSQARVVLRVEIIIERGGGRGRGGRGRGGRRGGGRRRGRRGR